MAQYQRKNDLPESVQQALNQLATRLKSLRKKKGIKNYERFAWDAGISRNQIWKYENAATDLRFSVIVRLAEAHGMSLAEFFSEGFEEGAADEQPHKE